MNHDCNSDHEVCDTGGLLIVREVTESERAEFRPDVTLVAIGNLPEKYKPELMKHKARMLEVIRAVRDAVPECVHDTRAHDVFGPDSDLGVVSLGPQVAVVLTRVINGQE